MAGIEMGLIRRLLAFGLALLALPLSAIEPDTVSTPAVDLNELRILTWNGYVTDSDIATLNRSLQAQGYPYTVRVIEPYAEGAEQMFKLIRFDACDISFLTLFFIDMQQGMMAKLLQPINVDSPRLSNYRQLLPGLSRIKMGMAGDKPLYIPFGGGAYGFWADMRRVTPAELPRSVRDLWLPKWQKKFSLNIAQPWYNVGLTLLAMGHRPFYLNELVLAGQRQEAVAIGRGEVSKRMELLYRNAGDFWLSEPNFRDDLLIVSSWGPEIVRENRKGANWQFIRFKEGSMVWLDTINFTAKLSGKRLEAAEIVANHFISAPVQQRVVDELSMVAVSRLVRHNPVIATDPEFYTRDYFAPPQDPVTDNLIQSISDGAKPR